METTTVCSSYLAVTKTLLITNSLQLGQFQWEGNNFADTADNVHFAIEGDGEVPVLRADLSNLEGATASVDVNLAERIVNSDGAFVFQ